MKVFVSSTIQTRPIPALVLAGLLALVTCHSGYAQDNSVGLQKASDAQRFELDAEQINALDRWIEQTRETW